MKTAFKRIAAGVLLGLAGLGASAQEMTLRMASGFPENTAWVKELTKWQARVNAEGKGLVQINFIGGPRAVPTFEIGQAVKSGVVDIILAPAAFYTNVLPEAGALTLSTVPVAEQRRNGAIDYINRVWGEKGNMYYLGRMVEGYPFHLYFAKRIDKLDLTGQKVRVSPVIRPVVAALGGNPINVPPGEIFTALERGVIDGYAWTIGGIFDLNLGPLTKFRVDPGFYDAEVSLVMNLDKWKQMSQRQKDFLQKMALEMEANTADWFKEGEEEKKRQTAQGVQSITFDEATTRRFTQQAYEIGWSELIKAAPQHGPRLRELLTRKP